MAIDECRRVCKAEPQNIKQPIYDLGIAVIFLCNLDPSKFRQEIDTLMKTLALQQKSHGGWGYPEKPTGDTSMTQYGALSAWEAMKVGFEVKREIVEGMTEWLIRTQDPTGGWGYQGVVPETSSGRVKQNRVTLCLTTAALGSSYVAADLLGFSTPAPKNDDPNIPSVLIPIANQLAPVAPGQGRIDPKQLKRVQVDGHDWFVGHFDIDPKTWTYYYLYALERYESFLEYNSGRTIKEPGWYNQGVEYLKKSQKEDGSWVGHTPDHVVADTSFGCLFLIRSMKKSIERAQAFGEARMAGGKQLPRDLAKAGMRDNKLVQPLIEVSAEEALRIVLSPRHPEFHRAADSVAELANKFRMEKIRGVIDARVALTDAYESASTDSRILILRIVGRMDRLSDVPLLISALDDESLHVRREGYENLERLTKRLSPFPPQALGSADDRAKLVDDWKTWYGRLALSENSGDAETGGGFCHIAARRDDVSQVIV
ncbi:MAG: prenyltransferase/squalene oxidase repeat-containing protein [Pirellulales bacterium]